MSCHACYRCPNCKCGPVSAKIVEDEPEGIHTYVNACRCCGTEFGLPWTERLHGESDLPTVIVGAEPWVEEVMPSKEPGRLAHHPALRWLPAGAVIAAISLVMMLWKLLPSVGSSTVV